jgi:hypothetical protein
MEYKIRAITTTEMQGLIDDGTFASLFTSSLPQLNHNSKPTYNWKHMSAEEKTDANMMQELIVQYLNYAQFTTHRLQKNHRTSSWRYRKNYWPKSRLLWCNTTMDCR